MNHMKKNKIEKKLKCYSLEALLSILPKEIVDYKTNEILYFIIDYEKGKLGYTKLKPIANNNYFIDFDFIGLKQALIKLIFECLENNYIHYDNFMRLMKKYNPNRFLKILFHIGIMSSIFILIYGIISFICFDTLWVIHSNGFIRFLYLFFTAIFIGIAYAIYDED